MARGRRRARCLHSPGAGAPPNPDSDTDAGGGGAGSGLSTLAAEDAGDGGLDFISMLPVELLIHILSFLEVRNAVRTKLLSRRWRYLYPSNAELVFDIRNEWMLPYLENFVSWVDKAMRQFRADKIKELFIFCDIDVRFADSVDEWIRRACEMKVEEINFVAGEPPNSCVFPLHLLPTDINAPLKQLRLASCFLEPLSSLAEPLRSVKTLALRSVHCLQDMVNFGGVASAFPNLENLTLLSCPTPTDIQRLCSLLHCLKSLCIDNVLYPPTDIVIQNVNLIEFTFCGPIGYIFFSGLDSFRHLSIYCPLWTEKSVAKLKDSLSRVAPQLKSLEMSTAPLHFFQFATSSSRFKHLVFLHLGVIASRKENLGGLVSFLVCAPLLQKFSILEETPESCRERGYRNRRSCMAMDHPLFMKI